MPSLAKPATGAGRERAEFALRTVALGALVLSVLLVSGTLGAPGASDALLPVVVNTMAPATPATTPVLNALRRVLGSESGAVPLHVLATTVPGDSTRALLSAARAAGVPVTWTDSTKAAAIAIEASAVVDPMGGVSLRAAAPAGATLMFRDSLGLIDSVRARAGGAMLNIGRVAGSVEVQSASAHAMTSAPVPAVVRRILLLADAGWEAKFTMAALEERGWAMDVRYALGRNMYVTQGEPRAADTARYAAVVALDSSALPHAAELRRYAMSGGGVVLAGAASTLRELGDLLPGRAGNLQPGVPGALATESPLDGISWRAITPDSDAVVLARSARVKGGATSGNATVVARRYGAGRVVQLAYGDVWEWRMSGPDGSVAAHRAWWSNMIGLVAFAPARAIDNLVATPLPGNAAPYADLSARLGKAASMPVRRVGATSKRQWEGLLLAVAIASLLLEWGSRRLRGAR